MTTHGEDINQIPGGVSITAHADNTNLVLPLVLRDQESHLLMLQAILKKLSDLTGVQFYYFHQFSSIDITTCSSSDFKEMANLGIFRNDADPPETLSSSIIVTCCLEKLLEELDKSFEQKSTYDSFRKELYNLMQNLELCNKKQSDPNIELLKVAYNHLTSDIKFGKLTDIKVKKKDFACEIFNLEKTLSDQLYIHDEDELQHQPLEYFVEIIIDDRWIDFLNECQESGECLYNLDSQLILLGFKTNCAIQLSELLSDHLSNAESAYYWAYQYLKETRLNHPLFNAKINKPLSTSNKLLNISDCNQTSLQYIKEIFEEKGFQFIFHAATENDLHSILSEGIILRKGGSWKDFSHRIGFYLFDSFEAAFRWSKLKCIFSKSYLIAFKIENKKLDCQKVNGLDVSSDLIKWKKIVQYFRSLFCKRTIDSSLKDEIDQSIFIKGPMLANFKEFIIQKKEPQFFTVRDAIVTQICIRNQLFAKELNSAIFGIISTGCGTSM